MSEKWFYSGGVSYACTACSLYANNATGAGAGGANGAAFNALFVFLGYADPCAWQWGFARSITLARSAVTGSWTMTALNLTAVPCYSAIFASALIDCAGGSIAGAYPLPATGNDPLCIGTLTITLP